MAVEARHLGLFPPPPPQFPVNRETMNSMEGNGHAYGSPTEAWPPTHGSATVADSITIKSYSDLANTLTVKRKRSRDYSVSPFPNFQDPNHQQLNQCAAFAVPGNDFLHVEQQQQDFDGLIALHTEKVRQEMEERRKRNSRRILAAVEDVITIRLRAKEEEIARIGKLNWALEERVKSLCVENQIWRQLAQINEATANALRSNLEQVLAQISDARDGGCTDPAADLIGDAQSCCGSNCESQRLSPGNGGDRGVSDRTCSRTSDRLCRNCGKEESCVLLLPCRHLCLCTACASSLHICPVCKSAKNAGVRVNMSI